MTDELRAAIERLTDLRLSGEVMDETDMVVFPAPMVNALFDAIAAVSKAAKAESASTPKSPALPESFIELVLQMGVSWAGTDEQHKVERDELVMQAASDMGFPT